MDWIEDPTMARLAHAAEDGEADALAPLADLLLEASPQDRLALVSRLARVGALRSAMEGRRIPVIEGDAPARVRIYDMSLHRGEQVFQGQASLPPHCAADARARYERELVERAMIAIGEATERGGWYAFRTRAGERRHERFDCETLALRADLTALHGGRIITREKE